MGKNTPLNGPSTTGNPSGGGRGNNPAWDDDDDNSGARTGASFSSMPIDVGTLFSRPQPRPLTARELREIETRLVDERVAVIQRSVHSKLVADLRRVERAYLTPGSAERQSLSSHGIRKHADAARRAADSAEASRRDSIELLVRKARTEMPAGECAAIEFRARRELGPMAAKTLDRMLARPASQLAREVADRVTIEQLLEHLAV